MVYQALSQILDGLFFAAVTAKSMFPLADFTEKYNPQGQYKDLLSLAMNMESPLKK